MASSTRVEALQRVKYNDKLHAPGDEFEMETSEAERLAGSRPPAVRIAKGKAAAATKPTTKAAGTGAGSKSKEPETNPYEGMNRDALVKEAEERKLTVTRADGKEGEPLVGDFEKALLADDEAKKAG